MGKHFCTLYSEVKLPYRLSLGPLFHQFYEGLKQKKILGSPCLECGKVWIPPRSFCPSCHGNMGELKEVSQEGQIVTWTIACQPFHGSPVSTPFIAGLVRLDGTDCDFLHLIGGLNPVDVLQGRRKISSGTRVKAVWRRERTGHMLDLAYFKLIG